MDFREIKDDSKDIYYWVSEGNLAKVKELLSSPKMDINALGSEGLAMIHYAADRGHKLILEFLIEKGANLNVQVEKK